jgi:hypothetical protein
VKGNAILYWNTRPFDHKKQFFWSLFLYIILVYHLG